MGKLSNKARNVLKEIADLGMSNVPKKHLDFVANYVDVLLGSLTKRETKQIFAYLHKKYKIDLYGVIRKERDDKIEKKLRTLYKKLHVLQMASLKMQREYQLTNMTSYVSDSLWGEVVPGPLATKIQKLRRQCRELKEKVLRLEDSLC